MTRTQKIIAVVLLVPLAIALGIAKDVFASIDLNAAATHRNCVERNYGMEPISYYEINHLYPKCL